MAFPSLSTWSLRLYYASLVVLVLSFHARLGPASAGWTSYPPLSTGLGAPGWGQTFVMVAVLLVSGSTFLTAVNLVTTTVRRRAPGMTFFRLPLTAWGLFLTGVLNVLFVPVLAVATLLLLLDRLAGTHFFLAGAAAGASAGDPIVYQHLFWMFGHPEVYILILPAWGMVGDLVAFFSRRPAHGYRTTAAAMSAVTLLSGLVYAHHLYTTGLSPLLGKAFMSVTLIISLPAEVMFLNWLMTLWRGQVRLASPMLGALGTMLVFGIGGVTGLLLAAVATNLPLHDTLWVVGHFHLIMAAATFLGFFAALYFWFPKIFGRTLHEGLARWHIVLSTLLFLAVFGGQLAAGWAGQHRRLFDPYQYTYVQHLQPLNQWTSYAAFLLAGVQGLFVVNFAWALTRGRAAAQNPWQVGTLEWTCAASPPAPHNFDAQPVVHHGPHALSHPEALRLLGRDWLGQAEPLPASVEAALAASPQGAP